MLTENYCDFETAKLLKEKGFNEPTLYYYIAGHLLQHHSLLSNSDTSGISAPTLQMATKWLRIEHNIHIWVEPNHDKEGLYNAHVKVGWWSNNWAGIGYNTDEAACEAAIKYCLKLLI